MEEKKIGHSVIRKEGRDKVTGRAQYVDDLAFPGMIHGVTVRSSIARGRIRGVRYGGGIPCSEFTIVHAEEPVVRLAHPDKYLLEEARRAVLIDVDPLPAIFSSEGSVAKHAIISGD